MSSPSLFGKSGLQGKTTSAVSNTRGTTVSGAIQDEPGAALAEVAEVADSVAEVQRGVAHEAHRTATARRGGADWSALTESGGVGSLLRSLGDSVAGLSRAAADLRFAAVWGLVRERWTTRGSVSASGSATSARPRFCRATSTDADRVRDHPLAPGPHCPDSGRACRRRRVTNGS